jgi:hypothetical protein
LIGQASRGAGLDRWEAALYLTPRSRKYFLVGSGGWMTRWATIE